MISLKILDLRKSKKMLEKEIRSYIAELGLDTFGIIKNPLSEDSRENIISIAFPYNYLDTDSKNGFSIYTKRLDYHKVVKKYLDQICEFIHKHNFEAKGYVDNNRLPEKSIAQLAGLGFIGRNGLIITKKYGSYVFLGEIITDFQFQQLDTPVESLCKDCYICEKGCPTNGIKNKSRCISYLTQQKKLNIEDMNLLGQQIFGCDICQEVCPHNRNISKSNIAEFETLSYMEYDADFYANMDKEFFQNHIKQTSAGWRGKNVIIRNAQLRINKRS